MFVLETARLDSREIVYAKNEIKVVYIQPTPTHAELSRAAAGDFLEFATSRHGSIETIF